MVSDKLVVNQAAYAGGQIVIGVRASLADGAVVMKIFTLREGDICAQATLSAVSDTKLATTASKTAEALRTLPDDLVAAFVSSDTDYCAASSFTFVDEGGDAFAADSENSKIFSIVEQKIVIN